jgi:C4-dicarboxylate transporter DctQ subunit
MPKENENSGIRGADVETSVFERYFKIWQGINLRIVQIIGWVLLASVLFIVLNVIMRRVFQSSIMGVVELTEYLLVYVCWLGLAWILSVKGHVSVSILETFLGPRTRVFQSIVINIMSLAYCAISLWLTWNETAIAFNEKLTFYGELGVVPQYCVFFIIPVGFALAAIQLLCDLGKDIVSLRSPKYENAGSGVTG